MDKQKNVLGCLSEIAYWEIDLLTGEFSMVNLQQIFEELELSIICIVHDPDYVYFTATSTPYIIHFEVAVQYVGAYNRHTHQIDWLRTAPDWSKEGWLNEIQKAGNRLYVKSGSGNLHVFEKN